MLQCSNASDAYKRDQVFHLTIIYIIFAQTSLYVLVLQVGKICVLDLPTIPQVFAVSCTWWLYFLLYKQLKKQNALLVCNQLRVS